MYGEIDIVEGVNNKPTFVPFLFFYLSSFHVRCQESIHVPHWPESSLQCPKPGA
jgi:hypothetical protein